MGRFAPSTSGAAHPGTLLAGLLAWLDGRRAGRRMLLRLEDLDPGRARAAHAQGLVAALGWLGLDWDEVHSQSGHAAAHRAALAALAAAGHLYACACSRAAVRAHGRRAADGGWAYPNTCRGRRVGAAALAAHPGPLRVRLPDEEVVAAERAGPLRQWPARAMGDPVVRRADGCVAYVLAAVVDDAAAGVTDVVRGRDLLPIAPTQVLLQRLLGLPTPRLWHHLLLADPAGGKLSKSRGAMGQAALAAACDGAAVCGMLAHLVGLQPAPTPVTPTALLPTYDWRRVRADDVAVRWDGQALRAVSRTAG